MPVHFREGLALKKTHSLHMSTLWRYLGTTEKFRCTIRDGTERFGKLLKNIFCIESLFHVEYHRNVTSESMLADRSNQSPVHKLLERTQLQLVYVLG